MSELELRGGTEDNSKTICLTSHFCCDPSLEPFNDGSQRLF